MQQSKAEPHDPSSFAPSHDGPAVRGVFTDPDAAVEAVEELAKNRVPTDEVEVVFVDARGARTRPARVQNDLGARRGALIGAFVGAATGFVLLIASLVAARFDVQPLGSLSFLGGAYLIGGCAAAGAPVGAAMGMGGLAGRKRLTSLPSEHERVMVVVETEELADVARRTLEHAGAQTVSG